MAMKAAWLALVAGTLVEVQAACSLKAIYADMHDGDKKEVEVEGEMMTIRPSGNNQTWVIRTPIHCSFNSEHLPQGKAVVDFNVPGKPAPPPVNLTATLWACANAHAEAKTVYEFTDPSGKLAPPTLPLNEWVELYTHGRVTSAPSCPDNLQQIYTDIHDGDKKEVSISGEEMTIRPSGNNQTWEVKTRVQRRSCSASVDFNVPGKPNPPPVALTASLWQPISANEGRLIEGKSVWEFTDTSGKLAPAGFPLNRWVGIGDAPGQGELHQ